MKINLLFEDKGKELKIPITQRELRDLYDCLWMVDEKNLELNKMDIKKIHNKIMFAVHDVMDKGKTYEYEDGKMILEKKPHYLVKTPKWRKR